MLNFNMAVMVCAPIPSDNVRVIEARSCPAAR
jgi:hypothetical protein